MTSTRRLPAAAVCAGVGAPMCLLIGSFLPLWDVLYNDGYGRLEPLAGFPWDSTLPKGSLWDAMDRVPVCIQCYGLQRTMRWSTHNGVLALELSSAGSVLGLISYLRWWWYQRKPAP